MKYLCDPPPTPVYRCPLSCGETMRLDTLGFHMRANADALNAQYAEQYGRLGLSLDHLRQATDETLARFALAYRRTTGHLPTWAPISTESHAEPSWSKSCPVS